MVIPTNKKRLDDYEVALNSMRYSLECLSDTTPTKFDVKDVSDLPFALAEHNHRIARLHAVFRELKHIVETMKK